MTYRHFFWLGCLFLTACVPVLVPAEKPEVVRQCVVRCDKIRTICNKVCHNNCRECTVLARRSAQQRKARYIAEQRTKGVAVIRQLNSWRDPLQCRKITCSCPQDYQVCVQACGRVIRKTLRQETPDC